MTREYVRTEIFAILLSNATDIYSFRKKRWRPNWIIGKIENLTQATVCA